MVKFGERLPTLKQKGWESFYIDYEGLKKMIEGGALSESSSATFLARLEKDLLKVDSFVQQQTDRLKKAAKDGSGSESALQDVSSDLSALRHYVGTNIIAATKIVKKHDKNASPALQKREKVGMMICSCAGINSVPAFQRELEHKIGKKPIASPLSVAVTVFDGDGDEADTESDLRALPRWLLSGTNSSTHGGNDEAMAFDIEPLAKAFLSDWQYEEHKPILIRNEGPNSDVSDAESATNTKEKANDWNVDFSSNVAKWSELTAGQKVVAVVVIVAKLLVIVAALYLFICSLSFLASGFRLVAGRQAGQLFRNSEVFNNPIAGMLVGVLVTVLVQSSSTSTSIIITMVAADLFTVRQAISLIMGANIGTSVTSTIVALAQSSDRTEFRRAFAAATVHDMFNFLCVLVLLPLEAATGYLYHLSFALLPEGLASSEKPPDILKALTKPFTKAVISIDKNVIKRIAAAETQAALDELEGERMLKHFFGLGPEDLSDMAAGGIVLIGALTILCVTLFLIVLTLKSLLKGRIAVWLHKSVNGNVPDIKCGGITIPMAWLSGYLAMLTGLFVTICVQSSSITTSALTPLVGVGVINIERMFPTVLGANIGTCITGLLAALAADGSKLYLTLQVAYSHLLFNLSGIVIFYVFWPLRPLPVRAAKFMGNTTADYRWFALAYLAFAFFLIPAAFMGLSLASTPLTIIVTIVIVLVAAFVVIVNTLQFRKPSALPEVLRTWNWLPKGLRSLEPLDRVVCGPLDRLCCAWWAKRAAKKAAKTSTKPSKHDLEVATRRIEEGTQLGMTSAKA